MPRAWQTSSWWIRTTRSPSTIRSYPLDHDGRLVLERADPGARSHEPRAAGGSEAEMLVEIVIVEPGNRGLEDVGRRGPPRRHTPSSVAVQKRRLGLRSREAELARERASQPGRLIAAKLPDPASDVGVCEPVDVPGSVEQAGELVKRAERDGARAILADRRRE